MAIVFCNIAWMERYQGKDGDTMSGGGQVPETYGIANEVCNFLPHTDGRVYGYVRALTGINLERLGSVAGATMLDGVTVVWTATAPDKKGTRIVGWYKNARVHKSIQNVEMPSAHLVMPGSTTRSFSFDTSADNAYCLPVNERITEIPRRIVGGMGHYPVWYAESDLGSPFGNVLETYITSETFPAYWSPAHKDFGKTAGKMKKSHDAILRYYQDVNDVE